MKLTLRIPARIAGAVLIALICPTAFPAERAELVLYNGKVITVDKRFSIKSAVVIKDGKILAVGGPTLVKQYRSARSIDLHGQVLLPGLYVAISRTGPDGRIFGLEEAVSRDKAIRLYTIEAAKLAWDETKKGSIEPGKFADLIVLDHDLLTVPAHEILNTKVVLTMVGGKIVYEQRPPRD